MSPTKLRLCGGMLGHGPGRWAVTMFQREQGRTASAGGTPGLNRRQGRGSEDGAG
jgi:hypothetical protein